MMHPAPMKLVTALLVLSLVPALAGCPRRSDSSGGNQSPSQPDTSVNPRAPQCLVEAPNGDLLIGITPLTKVSAEGLVTIDAYGVYRLPRGATTSVPVAEGLPKANVRALVLTPAGSLLAATMEGIYRTSGNSGWTVVSGAPQPAAYGLVQLHSGKLLAATNHGMLASSDDGKTWAAVGENRGEVNVIIEHPTRGIFAGTDKGVIHSADGNNPWESIGPAKETILALAVAPDGDVLAGATATDIATGQPNVGLAVMDQLIGWKAGVLRYTPPAPAAESDAGDGGKATKKEPATAKKAAGKPGADAGADAGEPDDAGEDGSEEADSRWKPAGLQNSTIWALATLPDGAILAASHSRGLQRWDPAASQWAPVQGIAKDNPVATLLVTSTGIWAGTVRGLFRSTDQGKTFTRATNE